MRPLARLLPALIVVVFALLGTAPAGAKTVWLCLPGAQPDPCTPGLSTTLYSPTGKRLAVQQPKQAKQSIDCFYVYPTVSDQSTRYANLHIDPEEHSIALYQTARYSQYCRVFAPMYRQLSLKGLGLARDAAGQPLFPVADVRAAFQTYLAKYNHGRGFVLIGHSQGAFVLRQLIAQDVDPKSAVRKRLVSAILLGGNVLVKGNSGIGGDFKNIPACRSALQLGCVIAYSTYDQPAPANSIFGRSPTSATTVLCTNPAALGGGSGALDAIFPSKPFAPGTLIAAGIAVLGLKLPMPTTVWGEVPDAYRASCSSANGAHVLEVTPLGGAPAPRPSPDASWGLHLMDGNIALGNLIAIVKTQGQAFVAAQKKHH